MFLEKINGPMDIKKLNINELKLLADETREALINKISKAGGHNGPNLGMVEMTVALHYVFNSPSDKIVFDVSHQCYPHKILTGRKQAFLEEEHFGDVTGYTNPLESEHDIFTVGHTSTSVSLALGVALGRDLNGRKENVIAVIGDGSLSGGEALEGLDYAGEYDKNLIIIVNDNDQSIAENHGGMYKTLKKLRETGGLCEDNIFKSFGLDYKYLDEGHDIEKLIALFESVKDINHPVLLHIHTIKGKGLPFAEANREAWHAGGPFNREDGSRNFSYKEDTTVFDSLKDLLDTNPKAIVLNAATPMGLGFVKGKREEYVKRGQFIDVGIAEENAVAMSSGIAKSGGTAVFGTFAPFFQRTYDQISHDLCLNDSPATMLVLNPGVYGMNSNTHIAICDIQMFAHIPNFIYLAPASKEEYLGMFRFATSQKEHPVGIRVPGEMISSGIEDKTDYSVYNKNKIERSGCKVALFAVGVLVPLAKQIAKKIKEELDVEITVVNPRFLSGLDEELLNNLKQNHNLVITIEDGELMGGYGQTIASFYGDSDMRVKNYGISKAFHTDFDADELLAANGISVENIVNEIKKFIAEF
ncbi:MAG: 1-deoxy-D-xylulose-5-phosphate synthase [Clostridia bacterium]|nr:1-deoxy-D-xylulose-5-phosphate synthase [Clostridia bacterium]